MPGAAGLSCPSGQEVAYYFAYQDIPALRASSYCGAADAEIALANATDSVVWRIPYAVESCSPAVGYTYSHAFRTGPRYLSPLVSTIHLVCKALPAPLGCASGNAGFASCPADAAAPETPPPPGTPEGGGPSADAGEPGEEDAGLDALLGSSCRADAFPAEAVGNPVFAGNGNKYQRERDLDGPPGLRLERHYNSSLPGWVHNHAMRVNAGSGVAWVMRPDGRALRFAGQGLGAWSAGPGVSGRLWRLDPVASGGVAWRFAGDDYTQEDFDALGRLVRVAYRAGALITAHWGQAGDGTVSGSARLVALSDAVGRRLNFSYDDSGRLVAAVGADGARVAYGYDPAGRLERVVMPDGSNRQYLYEDARFPLALTGLIDERGLRLASWAYDAQGRAVQSEHAGVARHQLAYGLDSTVSITDPMGRVRTQQYQLVGQRLRLAGQSSPCVDCAGDIARREIDLTSGLALAEVDFLGVRTETTWEATRRLPLARAQAAGRPEARAVQVEWHPQWRLPLRVMVRGRTSEYRYDEAGRLLSRTVMDGTGSAWAGAGTPGGIRQWTWRYDTQGLPASHTDPMGRTWTFSHDPWGQLASVTDPLGQLTGYVHDVAGRLLSVRAPSGLETRYRYNLRGWLTQVDRGGQVTAMAYTPTGRIASWVAPSGSQHFFDYDAADRLVSIRDERGTTRGFDLDAAGRPVREWVRDAQGQVLRNRVMRYDERGLLAEQVDATGGRAQFTYDANGRLIGEADGLGAWTHLELDPLGRTLAIGWPDQAQARLVWDPLDFLAGVTDPRGVATRYERNAFGELLSETSPDSGTQRFGRNMGGALTSQEDARGQAAQIERDALGRAVRIIYTDGQEVRMAYDASGALASLEDGSGGTQWQRDMLGRVTLRTQRVDDHPDHPRRQTVTYTWGAGGLESVTYPSGLQVTYRREAGRITGMDLRPPGSGLVNPPSQPWITGLSYNALGQPAGWRWASGVEAQRRFDSEGRIVTTEFARYRYDLAGRLATIDQDLWLWAPGPVQPLPTHPRVSVTWQAEYDSRHRLVGFAGPDREVRYRYDANGNRLSVIETQKPAPAPASASAPAVWLNTERERESLMDPGSNRLLGFSQSMGIPLGLTWEPQAGTEKPTFSGTATATPTATPTATATAAATAIVPAAATSIAPFANGLAQALRQSTQVRFTLDASGNHLGDGQLQATYNAAGRMARVRVPDFGGLLQVEYLYNALGQRVFKSEPQAQLPESGSMPEASDLMALLRRALGLWVDREVGRSAAPVRRGMAFLYGEPEEPLPVWALLGEYDGGSAEGRGDTEFLWVPTEDGGAIPVGLWRRGQLLAIHTDGLGTPRLISDDTGRPLWQWPYSGFGETEPIGVLHLASAPGAASQKPTLSIGGSATADPSPGVVDLSLAWGPMEMPLRFPGQYADKETGWFHNHWRTYSPREGRYLQADPIGLAGGENRFGYVGGNPLARIDPLGLDATVTVFQGQGGNPFGHVGISVNDGPPVGIHPAPNSSAVSTLLGAPVPGRWKEDSGNVVGSVTIPLSRSQDQVLSDYLKNAALTPGSYRLGSNNCATSVGGALRSVSLDPPSFPPTPGALLNYLRRLSW